MSEGEAEPGLHWRYLEQYGAEVLCPVNAERPFAFGTVYQAVAKSRALGGCSLGRCLHAPMRWVLVRQLGSGTPTSTP